MSKLMNMKVIRSRLGLAVLAAVATAVVVGGVSYASIPDSNGLVHGCYKSAASSNGTHKLAVINPATTSACPSGYTGLDWNADGPNGYSVQTSDSRLNDTFTEVANLSLPAGSYIIDANAWLDNTSPSNSSSLGVCEVVFGSATDEVEAGLLGPSSAPLTDQTPSLTIAGTVTSPTNATLSCEAVGNTGETTANTASMTAVQVGSLNP
jgi:hypothetical protein